MDRLNCHQRSMDPAKPFNTARLVYDGTNGAETMGQRKAAEMSEKEFEALYKAKQKELEGLAKQYNQTEGHVGHLDAKNPLSSTLEIDLETYLRQLTANSEAKQVLSSIKRKRQELKNIAANLNRLKKEEKTRSKGIIEVNDEGPFKAIQQKIKGYNEGVRSKLHQKRQKNKLDPVMTAKGGIDIDATIEAIDDIIMYQPRVNVTRKERETLFELKGYLNEAKKTKKEEVQLNPVLSADLSNPDVILKETQPLMKKIEEVEKQRESQLTVKKKPVYHEVASIYDAAIQSDEFRDLIRDANGHLNPQRADENRRLFLAHLQVETNDYNQDPADNLSSNYEENIKNHPALYEAWMEITAPKLSDQISQAEDIARRATPAMQDVSTFLKNQKVEYSFLPEVPSLSVPPTEKECQDRIRELKENIRLLENQKIKDKNNALDSVITQLRNTYLNHAKAELNVAKIRPQKTAIDQKFTKEYFKGQGRAELLKALMKRFQNSVQIVDQFSSGELGEGYHLPIRALLISQFSRKGSGGADKSIRNAWILEKTKVSDAFNSPNTHKAGAIRQQCIELAFAAGEAAQGLHDSQKALVEIDKLLQQDHLVWEDVKAVANQWGLNYSEALLYPEKFLENEKERLVKENEERKELIQKTETVLKQPIVDGRPHPFLLAFQTQGDAALAKNTNTLQLLSIDQFKAARQELGQAEINHALFEKDEASEGSVDMIRELERMGLDTKTTYDAYVALYLENPENTDMRQWDEWFDKDPQKLANVMIQIIPPPEKEGAQLSRDALVAAILSKKEPSSNPQVLKVQTKAREMVGRIKAMIEAKAEAVQVEADALNQMEKTFNQAPATLKGKLKEGYRSLRRMLYSGDIVDKGLAGLTIVGIAMYLKAAWNREGTSGKLAFASLVGGMGALWYEKWTGNSIIEKLSDQVPGQESVRTHEQVLINEGQNVMIEKGFKAKEFKEAQFALRKVRFKDALALYEEGKKPYGVRKQEKMDELYRALNIDDRRISPELPGKEKMRRNQSVVFETIARSIEFSAKQRGKPKDETFNILKEMWVTNIEDKNHPIEHAEVLLPEVLANMYRQHPEQLTFEKVMQTEVSPYLIQQNIANQVTLESVATGAYNWISEKAETVLSSIQDTGAYESVASFAQEKKLYLEAEGKQLLVRMQSGDLAATIDKVGDDAWEISSTAVAFPFKLIKGGAETLVPALRTAVEWADKTAFPPTLHTAEDGQFLSSDIAGEYAWEWDGDKPAEIDPKTGMPVVSHNLELNPEQSIFGKHQYPIWKTFEQGPENPDVEENGGRYYTQMPDGNQYLIVEVLPNKAFDATSPDFVSNMKNRESAIKSYARAEALTYFMDGKVETGTTPEQLNTKLEAIAGFTQSTPRESTFIAFHLPEA